ncbi:MAG: cation:proton antiporter regulatory subunit, partial [Snowella sp.]
EMLVPENFDGKTLAELQLRKNYGVNLLAIGSDEKFKINPSPEERLSKGMIIVLIGSTCDIHDLAG